MDLFGFVRYIQSEHRRIAKNQTPRGQFKAEILVQLSRAAPKVWCETQDILGSLQPQNEGPVSLIAAPKRSFFRTGLIPMHWEMSSLTQHELQQVWNSHQTAQRNWWAMNFLTKAPVVKCTDFKSHFCHTQFLLASTMFLWPLCPAEQDQLY